jgi:hypothetical protein
MRNLTLLIALLGLSANCGGGVGTKPDDPPPTQQQGINLGNDPAPGAQRQY